jgi:Mg-chelatase subunit ChlD
MRTVLATLSVGLLLAAAPVLGQQGGSSEYKIELESVGNFRKVENGNAILMVKVRFTITRQGESANVGADYKILIEEDGRPAATVDVPRATVSEDLSTVLVVDISGSMAYGKRMEQTQAAARVFFQNLPPLADAGLILFDHELRVVEPLRKDRQPLLDQIAKARPGGGTAYLDATAKAIEMLAGIQGRERAVVVMTDGVDLNSKRENSLEAVIRKAKAAGVHVYTVGIGEPGRQEKVTTVLVLDKSGSMLEPADDQDKVSKIDALRGAADLFMRFVRETNPPIVRTTILSFSDVPAVPQPFTNDRIKLQKEIRELDAKGETALFDATYEGIMALQAERPPGKRAIVALTDGVDNSSRRRVDEVIREAKKAKIPIYTLGFGRSGTGELDEKVMKRMADETGGEYFHAKNQKALMEIFEKLSVKLHDDGIDEAALKQLAGETGGKYFPARDVNQLQLVVKILVTRINRETREVDFPSLVQADDGRQRAVTLKLLRVSSNQVVGVGDHPGEGGVEVVQQTGGTYQVHGLVIPEVNHFVYLGLLGILGVLLALPAGLRRLSRSER